MKGKEKPQALTKEGLIHEVKKDHEGLKSQKEEKKKEIIIKKRRRRGPRLDQARGHEQRSWSGQRICSKMNIKAPGP